MLDDWNIEYSKLVERWDPYIDFALLYEYDSFVSKNVSLKHAQVMVWPFPRQSVYPNALVRNSPRDYNFFGSIYLNRLPWIFLINRFLIQLQDSRKFHALSSISAGNYKLTIRDYLQQFIGDHKAFFHFLERTPGTYTLTASVWDSLANGSLTIVQTDHTSDPLDKFFMPGVHYLRFSCSHELKEIIDMLNEHGDRGRQIAAAGYAHYLDNYSALKMFTRLVKELNFENPQTFEKGQFEK